MAALFTLMAVAAQALSPGQPPPGQPDAVPVDARLTARVAAVEKAIDQKRRKLRVPGVALAIVKEGRVICMKGFGFRDLERRRPVTPNTLFPIGSCTKVFTAMTVMMSADDGKLSLDDSPKEHLPSFKLRDSEADSRVTIHDLLCHRTGLGPTDIAWYTGALRAEEVIRTVGFAHPVARFRDRHLYQNVMYLVAGECVARAQKMPWEKLIARRIFQPLGMDATNTSARETQRMPDHAVGYTYNEETQQTTRLALHDLSNIDPAGAINSTLKDMTQWLRLMQGGGVYRGRRLVSERRFDALTEKHSRLAGDIYYGYGWILRDWYGHPLLLHGGSINGFCAMVALMPDQKLGVVMLANGRSEELQWTTTSTIWEHLVGRSPRRSDAAMAEKNDPGQAVDPADEAGTYRLTDLDLDIIISFKEGKLRFQAPGKPERTLRHAGGRRYEIESSTPSGEFVTFRPAQGDPKETEMLLEEEGSRFVLIRLPPAKRIEVVPALSVETLMQRVIEAAGGEATLRKHRTMVMKASLDYENQGLTGHFTLFRRAPRAMSQTLTLFGAAGKKIATIREYFDGTAGGYETSYTPPGVRTGQPLADDRIAADFSPELNWRKLFKAVTIKRIARVGDEEVYEVEKVPEGGSPVTDYISTKSFLLLQRDFQVSIPDVHGPRPMSGWFSDYRAVDGVMLPFRREQSAPDIGTVVIRVSEIRFDVHVPDSAFRPGKSNPH
jgi:CubicO group peptidase (beta-lactamase class C family)